MNYFQQHHFSPSRSLYVLTCLSLSLSLSLSPFPYTEQDYFNDYSANEIRIRRDFVVEDGYDALINLGSDIKKRLQIKFVDSYGVEEAGIDGGGLFKVRPFYLSFSLSVHFTSFLGLSLFFLSPLSLSLHLSLSQSLNVLVLVPDSVPTQPTRTTGIHDDTAQNRLSP